MKRRLIAILISLMSLPLFGQKKLNPMMTHDVAANALYNSGKLQSHEVTHRLQKIEHQILEQNRFTAALLEAYSTLNQNSNLNRRPRLLQNAPSPFNLPTKIHFQLTEDASNASIKLHNSEGKPVAIFPDIRNKGHVVIEEKKLAPGVYYYTLVIDGKIAGTKKMILTN
jgi:hypothetical protein